MKRIIMFLPDFSSLSLSSYLIKHHPCTWFSCQKPFSLWLMLTPFNSCHSSLFPDTWIAEWKKRRGGKPTTLFHDNKRHVLSVLKSWRFVGKRLWRMLFLSQKQRQTEKYVKNKRRAVSAGLKDIFNVDDGLIPWSRTSFTSSWKTSLSWKNPDERWWCKN